MGLFYKPFNIEVKMISIISYKYIFDTNVFQIQVKYIIFMDVSPSLLWVGCFIPLTTTIMLDQLPNIHGKC